MDEDAAYWRSMIVQLYGFLVAHPGSTIHQIGEGLGWERFERVGAVAFGQAAGVIRVERPTTLTACEGFPALVTWRYYAVGEGI